MKIIPLTIQTAIAIVINASILTLLLKRPSLRKARSNIFLINLIVSDLVTAFTGLIACFVHFTRSATHHPNWQEEKAMALFMFIFTSTMIATLIAIILVTLDRFIAVVKPFRYQQIFTRRNITAMLIVIWVHGALVIIAGLVCATSDDTEVLRIANKTLDIVYMIISSIGIAFLIFANAVILREIRRQIKLVSSVSVFGNDTEAAKKSETILRKKEMRAVYLCFSIVVLFIICWLPFTVGLALNRSQNASDISRVFMDIGKTLVFIGISLNPCLYVPFKTELRESVCKCFGKVKDATSHETAATNGKTPEQSRGNDKSMTESAI